MNLNLISVLSDMVGQGTTVNIVPALMTVGGEGTAGILKRGVIIRIMLLFFLCNPLNLNSAIKK